MDGYDTLGLTLCTSCDSVGVGRSRWDGLVYPCCCPGRSPLMDLLLRRVLYTLVPAIVVVALVRATILGDNGLFRGHRMVEDVQRAERKLAAIEVENARLEREVRQLRNDETAVRRAVAEELLLVPPGSVVYRFEE